MRLPGFNAEDSLRNASGRPYVTGIAGTLVASGGVLLQLGQDVGSCLALCDLQFDPSSTDHAFCFADCFRGGAGGGGNGGGGGGGTGRFGCGECNLVGGRWQRACVYPDGRVRTFGCRPGS